MIDLHLSAFAPRWRFLYAVRIDAYQLPFNCGKFATNKMQFLLSIADNLYEPVVGYQTSS